jgi:hypothetical protein
MPEAAANRAGDPGPDGLCPYSSFMHATVMDDADTMRLRFGLRPDVETDTSASGVVPIVRAAVKRLRRKLATAGAEVRIEAVRGVGFRLDVRDSSRAEGGSSALPAIVHDAIGRSSIRPVATVLHRRRRGGDLRQALAHRPLGRIGDRDVAEGDDAHEHVRLQNRQAPHLMLTHQIAGVRQPCIRSDGHRGSGGDVAHDDAVRIRALGEHTNHEVPIRDQADQSLAVCHGQHSHIQVAHLPSRIGDGGTR